MTSYKETKIIARGLRLKFFRDTKLAFYRVMATSALLYVAEVESKRVEVQEHYILRKLIFCAQ